MKRVFFTAYTNIPGVVPVVNEEPSLTWQHCKEECDIMHIVKKPNLGINPFDVSRRKPLQGDFSSVLDFQQAQNIMVAATEQFAAMPSEIRDRFNNDPVAMLSFIEDPKNKEECIRLGIFERSKDDNVPLSANRYVDDSKLLEPEKAGLEPVPAVPETVRT